MALVLETGVGLANADSLVSLAEVRAYASSRGLVIPIPDADLEQAVRKAHDYLLALEERLQGVRRTQGQALSFPRRGVMLYGHTLTESAVPVQIKYALAQLVAEGVDIMETVTDTRVVVEEQVGPLKTVYKDSGGAGPTFPRVDTLLAPFLATGGLLLSKRV